MLWSVNILSSSSWRTLTSLVWKKSLWEFGKSKYMVVLLKIHWQHVEHTLQEFQPMKQLIDILGKLPILNIKTFWLRQEPKVSRCRASVRSSVILCKRAVKMSSSSILAAVQGSSRVSSGEGAQERELKRELKRKPCPGGACL